MARSRWLRNLNVSNILAVVIALAAVIYVVPPFRHAVEGLFGEAEEEEATGYYYTCPMHPDIRLPLPGDCPICGMSLVRKKLGEGEGERAEIRVTPTQVQLTGVTTSPIRVRKLYKEIDTYGKIDYDERRLAYVASWIDGRIDTLFVDFTGVEVQKGHPMVSIYSPQLISGQQEYLLALDAYESAKRSGSQQAILRAQGVLESARQRLLYWGVAPEQIEELKRTRKVKDHLTIPAPIGGTVIHKNAFEGMYVKEGDRLFQIADLSKLWMYADIYEDEIPFLYQERPGDYWECPMHPDQRSDEPGGCPICEMPMVRTNPEIKIEITTRSFPGKVFLGTISFTDPFLNPKTRTMRVRVNIDNEDRLLRPEMYARARIYLEVGELLAVPENAVIFSGKRAIVLVDEGEGRFRPQPVQLGRRWLVDKEREEREERELVFLTEAIRYHEVVRGLEEGDRVVTSGNFLIGSESQLQGALAKMVEQTEEAWSREDSIAAVMEKLGPTLGKVEPELDAILQDYFAIRRALASDELGDAAKRAGAIASRAVNPGIKEPAQGFARAAQAGDLAAAREAFKPLSESLVSYFQLHAQEVDQLPVAYYCPMADARWLQEDTDMGNPYYGSAMLRCGEQIQIVGAQEPAE
jgi:Cu(I)/Ag(I) efflux system membrane fusion protein